MACESILFNWRIVIRLHSSQVACAVRLLVDMKQRGGAVGRPFRENLDAYISNYHYQYISIITLFTYMGEVVGWYVYG